MRSGKKKLWEDLMVVWRDPVLDGEPWNITPAGGWYLTRVTNHHALDDPAAPKYITHDELITSLLCGDTVISANSKQEALLKYAVSGRARNVWSIDDVDFVQDIDDSAIRRYRLVKEEF